MAMGLGLLLFASYAYFMPGPAWNEASRFDLVRALVERKRIDIDPYHLNTEDKAWHDGHHYSDKAPGASFLAAPAYATYRAWLRWRAAPLPESLTGAQLRARFGGRAGPLPGGLGEERIFFNPPFRRAVYICNLFTNAAAGAAQGVVLFLMLSSAAVAVSPLLALVAALALGLGSLAFAYSTVFFGHVLAGAFLLGAFALAGPFLLPSPAPPGAGGRPLGAGLLAGAAVLTELPAALGGLAIAGYLVLSWPGDQRWRAVTLYALGAALPIALLIAYQWAAFGGPLSTGYARLANPTFAEGMSRGVLGVGWPRPAVLAQILVGRSRGLLYASPVLLLGFVGLIQAVRGARLRREAILAGAIVIAFVALSSGYYMWWGGAALGPRHVVPALPFLCFGIPFAIARPGRALLVALPLLAISMANLLGGVTVSVLAWPGIDLLADHIYGNLLRGKVAIISGSTNLGLLLGLRGPSSVLPLVALWIVGLAALFTLAVRERR
jgi:hypothetical protein